MFFFKKKKNKFFNDYHLYRGGGGEGEREKIVVKSKAFVGGVWKMAVGMVESKMGLTADYHFQNQCLFIQTLFLSINNDNPEKT